MQESGRQRIGGLKKKSGLGEGGYASGAWKRPGDLLIEQNLQAASLDRGSWYYRTHAAYHTLQSTCIPRHPVYNNFFSYISFYRVQSIHSSITLLCILSS